MKEFKFIDRQILRILTIKREDKEVGNISYYRKNNSETKDIFDENLLNTFLDKYPQSTLELIALDTNSLKKHYEDVMIRKYRLQPVIIHFVQEVGLPDQLFGNVGDVYQSKKTNFNINISTTDEEFLKDLENRYEVLIPANGENEALLDSFIPL
jgi:hypothetical protein